MSNKTSILIVEDEWLVADDLSKSLQNQGYSVAGIADTGRKAMLMADQHKPDLILMDIILKGEMDGISAANEIIISHDLPIIFLTAYIDRQTISRARDVASYGYLVKPVSEFQLAPMVEMALARHELEQEREHLLQKLQATVGQIKYLHGILPVCASCKKIKDDDGSWQEMESYLGDRTEVRFTHGICHDCACRLYPDFYPIEEDDE